MHHKLSDNPSLKSFRFWFIFLLVLSSLFHPNANGASPANSVIIGPETRIFEMMGELEARLSKVGIDRFFIGGGGARAILDHYRYGTPLKFRDLDIFIVSDLAADIKNADSLGQSLQSGTLGRFTPRTWHKNKRLVSNPPILRTVGFGISLNNGTDILDVSVFDRRQDLDLNGVFDIDTILIPIGKSHPFPRFIAQLKSSKTHDDLVRLGAVIDPFNGYNHWRERTANLVHWLQVIQDPIVQSIRVVRSYGKLAVPIPKDVSARIRLLISEAKETNLSNFKRSLKKVLKDENTTEELQSLIDLGVFSRDDLAIFQSLPSDCISLLKRLQLRRGE